MIIKLGSLELWTHTADTFIPSKWFFTIDTYCPHGCVIIEIGFFGLTWLKGYCKK